ncbi:MAG: protein-glutamate O-methyltransferase CheR, partial [Chitinivibrionia bacterium]|nr:protein-glutamate O-methyltransferase CheR [Chitinivibrionia bacterium]
MGAVFRRYGHDFRQYARASVERRVRQFLPKAGCETVAEMIPKLLHDEAFFEQFLGQFSITVTEMFRDPFVYRFLRSEIMPVLKTYPSIRIWHAGCASGEEAYSLAIVLKEEGLYDRATIYATDFNDAIIEKAREGIYGIENMKQFTQNYQLSCGARSLSDYYHAKYGAIIIDQALRRNITFANHNLATDGVFTEAHLILCRNVLIYFDKYLQNRVLTLFRDSLVRGGFLCLGTKESIQFSEVRDDFRTVDERSR